MSMFVSTPQVVQAVRGNRLGDQLGEVGVEIYLVELGFLIEFLVDERHGLYPLMCFLDQGFELGVVVVSGLEEQQARNDL